MILDKMLESEEFLKELDGRISAGETWDKDFILRQSKEPMEPGDIKLLDCITTKNLDNKPFYVHLYKTFIKIKCESMKRDICRTY